MNFAESRFWILLISGLAVALGVRLFVARLVPKRLGDYDRSSLALLSLFLLWSVNWLTFTIFATVLVSSYAGLWWIAKYHQRYFSHWLWVLLPLLLLPLLFYKYADFALNDVLGLDIAAVHGLLIPVGISFYTFQKISFVVDTLAMRQPLPRFLDYVNFGSFFPQLVAGPIERRADLAPQVENFRFRWLPQDINAGAAFMVVGFFFKCCLADNLGTFIDREPRENAYLVWLANLLFGLRIYFDFAGYSLIALGVARCLGIRLTLNFRSPYAAASIVDFWRQWHVTLSQWFRDYVYIPLGGGRVRWWAFNVAAVFIISGIWHGAGWNFVLWGALHGAYLIVNRLWRRRLPLPSPVCWLLTMLAVFLAWLGFYETRTPVLLTKLTTLATPSAYGPAALREAAMHFPAGESLVLTFFLLVAGLTLFLEWRSLAKRQEPYALFQHPVVLVILVILTVLLAPGTDNAFIYFAF